MSLVKDIHRDLISLGTVGRRGESVPAFDFFPKCVITSVGCDAMPRRVLLINDRDEAHKTKIRTECQIKKKKTLGSFEGTCAAHVNDHVCQITPTENLAFYSFCVTRLSNRGVLNGIEQVPFNRRFKIVTYICAHVHIL